MGRQPVKERGEMFRSVVLHASNGLANALYLQNMTRGRMLKLLS